MAHSITFSDNNHYFEYNDNGFLIDVVISHIIELTRENDVSLCYETEVGKKVIKFDSNADREAARTAILSKL